MDTTWFAIDREGHVAVFESGEAGAVPESALGEGGGGPPDEEALAALPRSEPVHDAAAWRAYAGRDHVPAAELAHGARAALRIFVRDTPAARVHFERMVGDDVRATAGLGRRVRRIDPAAFEALHAAGDCQGCCWDWHEDEPAEGALFVYRHTAENWVSGPYAQVSAPSSPVPAAALPAELLEDAIRYDGLFRATPLLQPAEIWKCASWMPGWLSSDGSTVRPFLGREDEFRESMADGAERLVVAGASDVEAQAERLTPRRDSDSPPRVAPPPAAPPPAPATPRKPWWKIW